MSLEQLKKAAEAGDIESKYYLGLSYLNGSDGAPRDSKEAVRWLKEAADAGDGDSQNAYGKCLLSGNGVERNPDEAIKQFEKAADKGHPEALESLCHMHIKGPNFDKAISLATRAIEGFSSMVEENPNSPYLCYFCHKLGGAYMNRGAAKRNKENIGVAIDDYKAGQKWLRVVEKMDGKGLPPEAYKVDMELIKSTEEEILFWKKANP